MSKKVSIMKEEAINKEIKIRLSSLSKEGLDVLKKQNSYKTYSECILGLYHFFKENHISPREKINNSFISHVIESKIELKSELKKETEKILKLIEEDLKKFIREDSQSLRKRHGSIEKSYLLPMEKKVSEIHEYITEKSVENINLLQEKELIKPEKKEYLNDIKKLELSIKSKEINLKNVQNLLEDKEKKIEKYKTILRSIKEKISVEKSLIGKEKLMIEMSKEEFEKLLN